MEVTRYPPRASLDRMKVEFQQERCPRCRTVREVRVSTHDDLTFLAFEGHVCETFVRELGKLKELRAKLEGLPGFPGLLARKPGRDSKKPGRESNPPGARRSPATGSGSGAQGGAAKKKRAPAPANSTRKRTFQKGK